MSKPKRILWDYHSVFDAVIEAYTEARTATLTTSKGGFYSSLNKSAINSHFKASIPTLSDFACDVELAGKYVLTKSDFALFKAIYLEQTDVSTLISNEKTFKRINKNIAVTVGKEFVRRGIATRRWIYVLSKFIPIVSYFEPKGSKA